MAIPGSVIAAGWIPFIIVIVLSILFSGFYVRYFMSKYDSELSSTITCIFALTITLLTSAIVPVDIFLVSYMKNSDGSFKDWANSSSVRDETVDSVLIGYYVLYGVVSFCLFLLLPFMYFYYEEKEDDATWRSRCCSALKFSIVTVLIAATLLLIGAFVPAKLQHSTNGTAFNKVEDLFKNVASSGIEDALSFVISIFSVFGMIGIVTYTAYGMSAMPMDLVKGQKSARKERMKTQSERTERQERREERRQKYVNRSTTSTRGPRARRNDEEDRLMGRKERHLIAAENSCLRKCCVVLRPFEVVFGIGFFLLALLIFLSLLMTNIDKAMHSLGYKSGYMLPKRHLPNPIDIVLVFCQQVFPLDYILMVGIIAYFVLCSMSGIRNIGIWFLWIRMYKVRPRRTPPQGLLMFCMILMFIVLAINVLLYEITPQYSSFGSQHYINTTHGYGNHSDISHTKICTTDVSDDECIVTRMTLLLVRFFYKMWIFGAAYYWGTWLFLLTVLIGFFVSVIKSRRSAISGEVDEDDFDESDDDEMLSG